MLVYPDNPLGVEFFSYVNAFFCSYKLAQMLATLVIWVKQAKQQLCTCITLFLYISLPPLHDYDVKMPNYSFYGGRKQATRKFTFSF